MSTLGGISAVRKLLKYISDNELKEGSRLPTHEALCDELGMGFRPLHEGLSILSQQGLIETCRKAGTFVKKSSVQSLMEPISWHLKERNYMFQDIVRARAAVECMIAAEAARSRTRQDLEKMLKAIEQSEVEEFFRPKDEDADEAFHLAILGAAHNPFLLIFGKLIREQLNRNVPCPPYAPKWYYRKSSRAPGKSTRRLKIAS